MREPLVATSGMMTRINVTPIIDVALVLVIILLITAPIFSLADFEIKVPPARSRGAESDLRVVITLAPDGALAIDDQEIGRGALTPRLRQRLLDEPDDVLVIVRADEGSTHRAVSRLLREARQAGAQRLAIATRQKARTH